MKAIKEIIVVEGRDDTAAVKRAVAGETIETHGFGIRRETWALMEKAYRERGLIIFTDPDYSGEEIRRKLTARFPEAKQAYLSRDDATAAGDIGIENARPDSIVCALEKAHCTAFQQRQEFTLEDLHKFDLTGGPSAAKNRDHLGKALGIGYGNSKQFLNKLNQYGITREEFEKHAARQKETGEQK